jgi:hypothetical protein
MAPPLTPLAKVMATVLMIANDIAGTKTNTVTREPRMMPATKAEIAIAADIRSAPFRQANTLASKPFVTNALSRLVCPPDAKDCHHNCGQQTAAMQQSERGAVLFALLLFRLETTVFENRPTCG